MEQRQHLCHSEQYSPPAMIPANSDSTHEMIEYNSHTHTAMMTRNASV